MHSADIDLKESILRGNFPFFEHSGCAFNGQGYNDKEETQGRVKLPTGGIPREANA